MKSLIDDLLAEQRNLTAVERFARWHDAHPSVPSASPHRALIPLSKPAPGEQYAFEVDLDRCSGCKSCVTACHALNGLDEGETWRSVGVLHGQSDHSFQQTITTACHHCADPACLTGCPVLAYDKDPVTGIVRHLDDQCIGCEYCVLMCPYEVPRYSTTRGIVRKCDMCHQRLAHGEAPACVQACPSQAIRITVVKTDAAPTLVFPGAPDPAITRPTTRYISEHPLPARMKSGDAQDLKPQPAHMPLVWMLVLTQLGAGGFAAMPFVAPEARPSLSYIALAATISGLAASILHLGRPLKAWRAFLGLRRSWLSREIVVFGAFAALATAQTLAHLPTTWLTAAVGLPGVFCSGMTYHVTQRNVWRGELSIGRFFGTTTILGLAAACCSACLSHADPTIFAVGLAIAAVVKLSRELAQLRACSDDADRDDEAPETTLGRCAYLLRFRLGKRLRVRFACIWLGGVTIPLLILLSGSTAGPLSVAGLVFCLIGEWIERALFFRAAVTPKMPGNV